LDGNRKLNAYLESAKIARAAINSMETNTSAAARLKEENYLAAQNRYQAASDAREKWLAKHPALFKTLLERSRAGSAR
jgi:hypothetical protein